MKAQPIQKPEPEKELICLPTGTKQSIRVVTPKRKNRYVFSDAKEYVNPWGHRVKRREWTLSESQDSSSG